MYTNDNTICSLLEMRRPESPPNPAPEDEHLSTDPAKWPSILTDRMRTQLVCRGPSEVPADFIFPRNEVDGRSCHHQYFKKTIVNGEKIPRSWLVYSEINNSLFCFCCKLFSKKTIILTSSGLTDWKHASSLLTSHDNSPEHLNSMKIWKELAVRIKKGETIDNQEMALLEAEKMRWRAVLTRLTAIVQSLAVRNLALRGHTEILYTPSNGNFLKEVELMAKFDPIMKEHLKRVQKSTSGGHTSYLSHRIQNELVDLLSSKIISEMVSDIKKAKYFSLILDCTPDISHTEQLPVVIRVVSLTEPCIKKHFMGFLEAEESTGLHLASLILKKLPPV